MALLDQPVQELLGDLPFDVVHHVEAREVPRWFCATFCIEPLSDTLIRSRSALLRRPTEARVTSLIRALAAEALVTFGKGSVGVRTCVGPMVGPRVLLLVPLCEEALGM